MAAYGGQCGFGGTGLIAARQVFPLVLTCFFAANGTLLAQRSSGIDRSHLCGACAISLQREITLRDTPATPFGANVTAVARDSVGRIYVPSRIARGEVYLFSEAGDYIRTIGREGEGPGEYRVVNAVLVGRRDSIRLFDNVNARMTVLSSSFEVSRTARMPVGIRPTEVAIAPDGLIIAASRVATPERIGFPLHAIRQDGTLQRSYGAEDTTRYVRAPFALSRAVAVDSQGRTWAARRTSYHLELWDTHGTKQLDLRSAVPWFEPWRIDEPLSPDTPPLTWIQAIRVDDDGRLWVLFRISSEEFASSLVPENSARGKYYRIADYSLAFDTIIEVIDPVAGRLIASTRVDAYLTNFVDDASALGVREDPLGVPLLDVYRVQLKEEPQ